ncbi:MAG: UDP-glucose/GDP-mannose dehydrogenase family protein [Planctomycetes bacterium]|nr:UDP-glucose/GDP-mannose dehydrogenase family protein [Planctomycetota bacterium]
MKVSVIGTGYVGLVSGVCLAEKGHRVICVDIDQEKVDLINKAIPPIYEEGLEELLKKNVHLNLEATTDLRPTILETDLSLIAVGTPFAGDEIDLRYIKEVAYQIGQVLRDKSGYHMVVVKSTVVPGTTDDVVRPLLEEASGKKAGLDFGVGMNPEFLREGKAIEDFMFPDRIVLGGMDDTSIEALEELYRVFEGVDKLKTSPKTAEMIKYAANSLLATMISFSNEIANLCTTLGSIDVVEVMQGVHLDKRLSPILPTGERIVPAFTTYIEAGCGFGGSCFPKDVKALIAHGKKVGRPMQLLDAVIQINEQQPQQVLSLLKKHFSSLKGVRIAILGLAFKPGTDDMRESPAIPVVQELIAQEAEIKTYDPVAKHEAQKLFGNHQVVYCDDLAQTLQDAQAVVLLTRWEEFKRLPELLGHLEPQPLFIDGRRMLDKNSIIRYDGIGM